MSFTSTQNSKDMSCRPPKRLSFQEAIDRTQDVCGKCQNGLAALGKCSKKIIVPDVSLIDGSLDIDSSTVSLYPMAHRWDYALSYNGEVFYIEEHSAITSQVSVVIEKLKWLKQWLREKAPEINKLSSTKKNPYYWIQSSNFSIPKHTRQYKMAVQNRLLPISIWDYDKLP